MSVDQKKAEEEFKKYADGVTDDDVQDVLNKRATIEDKFRNNSALERFFSDLKIMFSLIQDYVSGNYREIPFYTIAAICGALLYVLSPIDLIPDFIPVVGYLDDAVVVALCLRMVEEDLKAYEIWKMGRGYAS